MADFLPKYDTSATTLTVTNLNTGLTNGAFWQSAAFDLSGKMEAQILVTLATSTAAGSSTGYANVYLACDVDSSGTLSGGASGSEGSYAPVPSASAQARNARFLGSIHMPANETTARSYSRWFSVAATGPLPFRGAVIIENATGAAFNTSGNSVVWRGVVTTSV